MTLKDALELKPGDPVYLTHDDRPYLVVRVEPQAQYVKIRHAGEFGGLELRGATAMRSLRAAK